MSPPCGQNTSFHSPAQRLHLQWTYLIEKTGANGRLHTLLQVCVGENKGGVFTPQLQGELLTVGGTAFCDALGGDGGAGEGDEGDIRMAHKGIPCSGTSAKNNVDDPWRDTYSRERALCLITHF